MKKNNVIIRKSKDTNNNLDCAPLICDLVTQIHEIIPWFRMISCTQIKSNQKYEISCMPKLDKDCDQYYKELIYHNTYGVNGLTYDQFLNNFNQLLKTFIILSNLKYKYKNDKYPLLYLDIKLPNLLYDSITSQIYFSDIDSVCMQNYEKYISTYPPIKYPTGYIPINKVNTEFHFIRNWSIFY